MEYRSLKGWLRALNKLANHSVDSLRGIEKLNKKERFLIGATMASIDNDIAEIKDILEQYQKPGAN